MSDKLVPTRGWYEVTKDEWSMMREMAGSLVRSGFLPQSIRTDVQALAVILAGREMGFPPMASTRLLHVVNGKVGLSAKAMLALAYRNIPGFEFKVVTSTAERCTVAGRRSAHESWQEVTFSYDEAVQAGLPQRSPTWKAYPQDMCRNRATTRLLDMIAVDSTLGMRSPEDMEMDVPERGFESEATIEEATKSPIDITNAPMEDVPDEPAFGGVADPGDDPPDSIMEEVRGTAASPKQDPVDWQQQLYADMRVTGLNPKNNTSVKNVLFQAGITATSSKNVDQDQWHWAQRVFRKKYAQYFPDEGATEPAQVHEPHRPVDGVAPASRGAGVLRNRTEFSLDNTVQMMAKARALFPGRRFYDTTPTGTWLVDPAILNMLGKPPKALKMNDLNPVEMFEIYDAVQREMNVVPTRRAT